MVNSCFFPWNLWRTSGTIKTWQPYRIRNAIYQRTWFSRTRIRYQNEGTEEVVKEDRPNDSIQSQFPHASWSIFINPQPFRKSTINETFIFEKLKLYQERLISEKVPLVVVLVTPSWIELINDASRFVPDLLFRMFGNPEKWPGFDVLIAVVDKIPHPLEEDIGCKGSEGISVSTFESETATPDLWSPRDRPTDQRTMTIQQRCTLSFQFQPIQKRLQGTPPSESHPVRKHLLQLPVANTLFHNGQTSTLFAERWAFSAGPKSSLGFVRTKKVSIPRQILRVPSMLGKSEARELHNRLKSITPSRIVAAATGNIIQKIYLGPDGVTDQTVPASSELESVVSQLINTRQSSAEKVEIWALVTPGKNERSHSRLRSEDILTLVEGGSRLHKVLSGGGGWGVKQGLLALDPDPDFSNYENEIQLDLENNDDTTSWKSQFFGEIVKPGDRVEFFTFRPPEKIRLPEGLPSHFAVTPAVYLGTLPSSMDMIPDQPVGFDHHDFPAGFSFLRNHFGMLTEHGMTLKVETLSSNDSLQSVAGQVGSVVQTKLDVPFTCFVAKATLDQPA